MPINRQSFGQKPSSRLTSSTISSSAKNRPDGNDWNGVSNEPIMSRTTNLTRTRSLRLPQKSRDQYLMSGHLVQNNTTEENRLSSRGIPVGRLSNTRLSYENNWSTRESKESPLELSLNANKNNNNNNVTVRTNKWSNQSFGLKEALIPKFVRNSFGKLTKNSSDDNSVDKFRNRISDEYRLPLKNDCSLSLPNDCPHSPMSNSSRDSGPIVMNGQNLAQNYLNHLKKLSEEHEKLQMEYSRLRLQLIETTATLPNKLVAIESSDGTLDIELQLKKEKSLANNYKTEIIRLQDELKRMQRKYWENLLNQKTLNRNHTNGSDADILSNSSNSQNASLDLESEAKQSELEEKIRVFENKIKELETETKEAKESIEFLTSERTVLADSLKEAEENLLKERLVWIKEKETFEEVKVWSKRIYDKLKEKSEKMKELETNINEKNDLIEKLMETNKLNESFAQNSVKLLNRIRDKVVSVLDKNKNSAIVSKLWPQFESIEQNVWTDIQFDINVFDDIPINNNKSEDIEHLKQNISELIRENVSLKRDSTEKESTINEKNQTLQQLKTENESNLKKLIDTNNQLDVLKEKFRCSESVNRELKSIIDKSNGNPLNSKSLEAMRLENASLKESVAIKDEMIDKLSAKYSRNRKVWEENERKATDEIKKLDDMVDHVIETLKSLPENYRNSEQIIDLLEVLSDESCVQNNK